MGGHSSGSLTIPRCQIGTRSWPGKSEWTLRIHYVQVIESAGYGASTLALTPMGGVNQSPKQRVPVVPQKRFDGLVVSCRSKPVRYFDFIVTILFYLFGLVKSQTTVSLQHLLVQILLPKTVTSSIELPNISQSACVIIVLLDIYSECIRRESDSIYLVLRQLGFTVNVFASPCEWRGWVL